MNKIDNKRKEKSKAAIQKAYLNLVVSRSDVNTITVSDICKKAKINRTTFYAHYLDLDDLIQSIYDRMLNEFLDIFKNEIDSKKHSYDFNKLFRHIKDNQLFYKLYFKLGFDFKRIFIDNGSIDFSDNRKKMKNEDYHIEFFSAGITALIKKWLANDCKESPETISKILFDEYKRDLSTYR